MIQYLQLYKLGFSKCSEDDPLFEDMYGFSYFRMERKLTDDITIEWGPIDGCFAYNARNHQRIEIRSYNALKDLLDLFSEDRNEEFEADLN